jgi:hypothetical protein
MVQTSGVPPVLQVQMNRSCRIMYIYRTTGTSRILDGDRTSQFGMGL